MSTLHIKELLIRYQNGDSVAFEEFFSQTHKFVYNLLRQRVNNPDDVNDLFQNVFLRIHQYVESYNEEFNPITWISSICRNVVFDYLKAKKHRINEEFQDFDHRAPQSESEQEVAYKELLLHFFPNLPDDEKKLIVQRFVDGEDYEYMASINHTSTENIRKKISRILLRAKKLAIIK